MNTACQRCTHVGEIFWALVGGSAKYGTVRVAFGRQSLVKICNGAVAVPASNAALATSVALCDGELFSCSYSSKEAVATTILVLEFLRRKCDASYCTHCVCTYAGGSDGAIRLCIGSFLLPIVATHLVNRGSTNPISVLWG